MPNTFNVGARSIFVTLTAWVFILFGALASASALVQSAALVSLLPGLNIVGERYPVLPVWLAPYLPWVVGAGLALALATLASAIGLLLRLEWARRVFIGLVALALVANLLGLWLQQELLHAVVELTLAGAPLPPEVAGVFGGFVAATRGMAVVVTLSACAMLGWIIRRLMSPLVRQEFA